MVCGPEAPAEMRAAPGTQRNPPRIAGKPTELRRLHAVTGASDRRSEACDCEDQSVRVGERVAVGSVHLDSQVARRDLKPAAGATQARSRWLPVPLRTRSARPHDLLVCSRPLVQCEDEFSGARSAGCLRKYHVPIASRGLCMGRPVVRGRPGTLAPTCSGTTLLDGIKRDLVPSGIVRRTAGPNLSHG